MTGKVNPLCYWFQKTGNFRSIVVHVNHLNSYVGEKAVKSWFTVGKQEQTESGSEGEWDEGDCQPDAAVHLMSLLGMRQVQLMMQGKANNPSQMHNLCQ